MNTISSCVPADVAELQWDSAPDFAEYDAREKERRVDEEMAWIRSPEVYCERAGEEVFYQLVSILNDAQDDKIGRLRDVLHRDMSRVAKETVEAEHD